MDADISLSIEDEAEERGKPSQAEEEDPIDDQYGSSQPFGRKLFGFYYLEEADQGTPLSIMGSNFSEEASSTDDPSPPASPFKYSAAASSDTSVTTSFVSGGTKSREGQYSKDQRNFRAALSSPLGMVL
jgi:hypothetical protein